MKIIRNRRSNRFTLVELLVAMAVFSILMLLMVQFFSASQRIWVNMEQKNNLYADARVAMDLITTLIQGTYFTQGTETDKNVPYLIKKDQYEDTDDDKIYFPTQSQIDLIEDAGKVIFVSIQRATNANEKKPGQLRMAVLSDKDDKDFNLYFPPYGDGAGFPSVDSARNQLEEELSNIINKRKTAEEKTPSSTDRKICVTLLDNITAFRLKPIFIETPSGVPKLTVSTSDQKQIPFMIEIQISMMSKKNYDFWVEMKNTFGVGSDQEKNQRLKSEHTFTRTVYIGDRQRHKF